MPRFKDTEWDLPMVGGRIASWDAMTIAALMDIRDELKRLNKLLHCDNFVRIPRQLAPMAQAARRINATAAKRRKAKR